MNVKDWLDQAETALKTAGVETPRLDVYLIAQEVLHKDKAWILAHPEYVLQSTVIAKLQDLLARRTNHEPIAYITGKSEFYGREFVVTTDTMQPRPETEALIDIVKELPINSPLIADVGAGCGAIGLTLALELPESTIDLYEISPAAAKIAHKNVKSLDVTNAYVHQGDLLTGIRKPYDLVVANLPYVPDGYKINQAATHEPRQALFGGRDGLDVYRVLFEQLGSLEPKPRFVLCESLPFQHQQLSAIALSHGFRSTQTVALIQVFESL